MAFDNFNKRIEIQRKTQTATAIGEMTDSWAALATVWAHIEPLAGKELYWAQQIQAEASVRITIRHYDGLTSKDRLKFGTRYYSIVAPPKNIDEKGCYDELLCTEVI
jgi:SPP1 family predicted phage head-tail adaptor